MSSLQFATVSAAIPASEWKAAPGLPFEWGANPDLWLHRHRTLAILHRFLRLSCEAGRLPSVLGQEFFRNHITSHTLSSFEDVVIFVHDVERCLSRLDPEGQHLIARIALQGFNQEEVARFTGCAARTIGRRYIEALDQLTEILLNVGILLHIPETGQKEPEACQEADSIISPLTM